MPSGGPALNLHVIVWNFFFSLSHPKKKTLFSFSFFFLRFLSDSSGLPCGPASHTSSIAASSLLLHSTFFPSSTSKNTPYPPSPSLPGETEYNARIRGISESMTPQSDRHRSYSFSGLSTRLMLCLIMIILLFLFAFVLPSMASFIFPLPTPP